VGPRAGLDRCGKSRPTPGFDPRTVQPGSSVAIPTELPGPHEDHCTFMILPRRILLRMRNFSDKNFRKKIKTRM